MALDRLPTEILRKILSEAEWPLTNVSLACRRLHDVAEPILYEKFRGEKPSAVEGYLKAILRRPYLATYIKSFHSPTFQQGFSMINGQTDVSWITEESRKWLRSRLQNDIYGKEKCDRWCDTLAMHKNSDAVLGFLLHLVSTRVEYLVLRTEGDCPHVRVVAEAAAKAHEGSAGAQLFSKLKTVHLDYMAHPDDTIGMDFVLPYLKLKSVVTLSVNGLADETHPLRWRYDLLVDFGEPIPSIHWRSDPFQVFSIVDLTLTRICMGADAIKNLLWRFHALKRFKYDHMMSLTQYHPDVSPSAIIFGLEHSKHCLEILELRRARENTFGEEILSEHDQIVPIKDFERLRTLIVDSYFLIGKDHRATVQREPYIPRLRYAPEKCEAVLAGLPETLACLEIEECRTSVFDFLKVLLLEYELSPIPSLTTIKLMLNGQENQRIVEHLWKEDDWEQRGLQKGMALTLIHPDHSAVLNKLS